MTPAAVDVVLDDLGLPEACDVGQLACNRRGSTEAVRFAYTTQWLERKAAFALDPELPLHPGDVFASGESGMFGVFRDTAPDRWGRVLLERREALEASQEGRRPRRLGEWEFLLGVADTTRIGALRLCGAAGEFLEARELSVPPAARLRELEAAARALEEPDCEERSQYEAWLKQLLAPGSSLGGARPKANFAETDGTLWIAKFPSKQDRHDVGAWELLAHELARRAGVDVPKAKGMRLSGEHHIFAVQRFDRMGQRRRLYMSAMTALMLDDGDAASYLDLAQAVQDYGDPTAIAADLEQLFRRALFNVLVGNRDDHLRNHGFLRAARGWRLAPAFDVNPNPHADGHVLALDESERQPSIAALRTTREYYRLSAARAAQLEAEVREAFDDWPALAKTLKIKASERARIEAVIDPTRA